MALSSTILSKTAVFHLFENTHTAPWHSTVKSLALARDPADPPHQRLVVQVPHSDVAVAAAGEADLGVRTDGQGIAGGRRGGQLRLDARRGCRQVPDGQGAGFTAHNQTPAVRQQLAGTNVVVPVLGGERSEDRRWDL